MATAKRGTLTERFLGLFADVHHGEAVTAVLLALDGFLLLTSYYLLKVAREPLILVGGGAEVKSYAAAGQALLLVGVVKANDWLTRRFHRMRLIAVVTLFFASNLVLFYALSLAQVRIGVAFFLWVGVFSVTLIAQFWSFANDLYTPEQGKRLFAIVGIGTSVGAVAGAHIARWLIAPLGPYRMMMAAAAVLLTYLSVVFIIHRRETHRHDPLAVPIAEQPLGKQGGYSLVWRDRYLLLIAALVLLLNWVNTTGEYILDRTLISVTTPKMVAGVLDTKGVEQFIGAFKASYFEIVNVASMLLQFFVASRVLKYFGVRSALFILPLVALAAYGAIAVAPLLMVVATSKVAENSLDYSINNTARQALFLVTSREAKYKAKTVIDSFLQRAGDVVSAGVVWAGTSLAFSTRNFATLNLAAIAVWLMVVAAIARQHRRREPSLAQAVT